MENASSPVMDDTTNNRSFFARGHGESLENRKFYLYFEARRPRIEDQIVEELRHLGAVVEPFFGRDISYVITDMLDRTTATRGTPVSDGILSDASSSDEGRRTQPVSARGKAIIRKATQVATDNICELCRQWKIKILYISDVFPWLRQLKRSLSSRSQETSKAVLANPNAPQRLAPSRTRILDSKKSLRRDRQRSPVIRTGRVRLLPPWKSFSREGQRARTAALRAARTDSRGNPVTEEIKFYCVLCDCSTIDLMEHLDSDNHQDLVKSTNSVRCRILMISEALDASTSDLPSGSAELSPPKDAEEVFRTGNPTAACASLEKCADVRPGPVRQNPPPCCVRSNTAAIVGTPESRTRSPFYFHVVGINKDRDEAKNGILDGDVFSIGSGYDFVPASDFSDVEWSEFDLLNIYN
ncbi:unnamed protein product [Ixodes pacificus]